MTKHRLVERADFPALSLTIDSNPISYLDSAATTLKPQAVVDAVSHYYCTNGANVHRGNHRLSDDASSSYEESRHLIANYIGAQVDELAFTGNTTHSLNIVAQGLLLREDDLVITGLDSHHSNILPWRRVARLEFFRTMKDGRVDLAHFEALLKKQPRVVALTHCSNVTGVIHPVEKMADMTRAMSDATVVLDAAQSIPHTRLNLKKLGVDFMAFSGHKMLGPSGIGFLCGRRDRLEALQPLCLGGGTVDSVDERTHVLRRAPYHLEAGTPPIASVIGMAAAIRYLMKLDETRRNAHDQELIQALIDGASSRDYLALLGPGTANSRHALGSLRFAPQVRVGELARLLSDSYGIMCRSGYLCSQPFVKSLVGREVLRVSTYVYNEAGEIERLFDALDELADCMGIPALESR